MYARSTDFDGRELGQTPRDLHPLTNWVCAVSGPAKFFVWQESLWAVVHMGRFRRIPIQAFLRAGRADPRLL